MDGNVFLKFHPQNNNNKIPLQLKVGPFVDTKTVKNIKITTQS